MPSLHWASKSKSNPVPAPLDVDSVIYPQGRGYPAAPITNRLFLGENLGVMAALLPEYEGQVDLIYADPPFFTNRRYPARVGRGEDSRRPQEWKLAEGYPDAWDNLEAYLDMLYPRLALMHRLLSPTGTLYLHLDWHANAYARLLLDEIFGADRLLNEIVWCYHGPSPIRRAFNRKHDTILAYTKSQQHTFNADDVRQPYNAVTVKTFASSPRAGFGKMPDLERGKVPEDWWYFPVVARMHNERTGYPTQKPEALLERILLASSNPGDLVADFFCGSGSFPAVAARLGRRFLAADVTWRAIHTSRARLIIQGAPAFRLEIAQNSPTGTKRFHCDQVLPGSRPYTAGATLDLTSLKLPLSLAELDYWEIDPRWDGQVFRSAGQVVRPRKATQIATELSLPITDPPVNACIRLVQADGAQYQFILGG